MLRRISWILMLLALRPPGLQAQASSPGTGNDAEVGAALSARSGVTWIGSQGVPILALAGVVRLSQHLELGGEGVLLVRSVRVSPEGSPDASELRSGYGGLILRWKPAGNLPGARWGGSLLLGSGTARVRSRLVEADLASQNFLFLEPSVHLLLRQDRTVRLSADAGYRITFGADSLPGLGPGEFRAPMLSLTVQVVRDP